MTIHLPKDVENSVLAKVQIGLFPSIDAAMTVAARLLLERIEQQQAIPQNRVTIIENAPDPLLGSMRDYADEMDEIVAEAMKQRGQP